MSKTCLDCKETKPHAEYYCLQRTKKLYIPKRCKKCHIAKCKPNKKIPIKPTITTVLKTCVACKETKPHTEYYCLQRPKKLYIPKQCKKCHVKGCKKYIKPKPKKICGYSKIPQETRELIKADLALHIPKKILAEKYDINYANFLNYVRQPGF